MSNVLKQGTTIFTGKPFVFIVKSECRTTRCNNCLKNEKLLKCSGCQYVYYCNRNCQKKSWSIHKAECAHLKELHDIVQDIIAQDIIVKDITITRTVFLLQDLILLMARTIIKLNQGGADKMEYYNNKNIKFKDLETYYLDIKMDTKQMQQFLMIRRVLYRFLDQTLMPNFEELTSIYGKTCANNFVIFDAENNGIGNGIYLGASMIGHSCKPNAAAIFEGTTIIIRTIMDLPFLDLSQIRISYLDLLKSKKERREMLHTGYYFWCDCERCKKEEPIAEAAACPNSSCDSPCSIEADECEKCSTRISIEFKKKFQEVSDFTASHLKEISCLDDDKNIIFLSKICLMKQKSVMHKLNVQHLQTLFMIYTATMDLELYKDAELYAKELLPGYLLYYGEVHPQTGILYFKIGMLELLNDKPKEVLQTLGKAGTLLRITHGDEHSEVKEKLNPLISLAWMSFIGTTCSNLL